MTEIIRSETSLAREAAALEYIDQGFSIIPIASSTKKPLIKWLEFQGRRASEDEVAGWFSLWPDAEIAIVTGDISGVVVVDCDNEEAIEAALQAGMRSPITVKTKRGVHMWFKHPRDGVRRGPRAGYHSPGADWPQINGLDFRGDGSYAVLPPSAGYVWAIATGHDRDDDMPTWKDWRPDSPPDANGSFCFEQLDLSNVSFDPDSLLTEWERTENYIQKMGFPDGKIPSSGGNGRNERVMRYAAETITHGLFGSDLEIKARGFMDHFYVDHLPEREFLATLNSVEQMERRNHPERFNAAGDYIHVRPEAALIKSAETETSRKLMTDEDADDLIEAGKNQQYFIAPWLPPQTIVQIHGYSGSGKTMFLQHALYAMATSARAFGPFEINHSGRVLYLDFELSRADLGLRLKSLKELYGSAGSRFSTWTPWIEDKDMNLRTAEGLQALAGWAQYFNPDVIVIDTIRTAWSGLSENSAEDWAQINKLAIKLRNAGASVVLLHHSNKPGEDGLGREAGSTNQLTVLETQIRIAQVYRDADTAKAKAGIWDGGLATSVFTALESKLGAGWHLDMVIEARYGKVRQWTDLHDTLNYIGWATNHTTGEKTLVSSSSTKQKAKALALNGAAPLDISRQLSKPLHVVEEWLEINPA